MRLPWKRKPKTELEQLTEFYGHEILDLEFEVLEKLEVEASQLAAATKYAICGELWGKLASDWKRIRFIRFPDKAYRAARQEARANDAEFEKWLDSQPSLSNTRAIWNTLTYNRYTKMVGGSPIEHTFEEESDRHYKMLVSKDRLHKKRKMFYDMYGYWPDKGELEQSNWSGPN